MRFSKIYKYGFLPYFLLIICCLNSFQIFSQWSQTGGPLGGKIRSLERVGNQVWAATSNGVYTSFNEGNSWNIHEEFKYTKCASIRCFSDTVIVLYGDYEEYNPVVSTRRSLDGGASWENPVLLPIDFYGLQNEKDSIIRLNNNLYILDYSFNSYVSYDFGQSWVPFVSQSLDNYEIRDIGKYGFITEFFGDYLYFNENLQTWSPIYSSTWGDEAVILSDSTFIVVEESASYESYNVKITNDYGLTWTTTYSFNLPCCDGPRLEKYEGAIYLKHSNNYLKSTNHGISWVTTTAPPVFAINQIAYPDYYRYEYLKLTNDNLLIASANGVRQSPENLSTSIETNTGLNSSKINKLVDNNSILYASTDFRTFKSINGGLSWIQYPDSFKTVISFAFKDDSLFFLCKDNALPFLMISFDNGQNWIRKQSPYNSGVSDILSLSYNNGKLYTGIQSNIWMSNNLGNSWIQLPVWSDNIGGNGNSTNKVGYTEIFNNRLYVYTLDGYILRFDEEIQNWNQVGSAMAIGATNPNSLTISENVLFASGPNIFRYSTNGTSWNSIPLSPQDYPNKVIVKNGIWYGSFYDGGVATSSNNGVSWTPLQSTVSFNASGGMVFLNDILFSASDNAGVWRRNGPLATVFGNIYRDLNNNGIKDAEDYDLEGFIVSTSPTVFASASNINGNYSLLTDAIGDTIRVNLSNSLWVANPSYYVNTGETQDLNFGVYVPNGISDLSIDLNNVNVFRPGFNTTLVANIVNEGSLNQSPIVKIVLDNNLSFINSVPPVNSQNQDTLIWNLNELNFWQSSEIVIQTISAQSTPIGQQAHCFALVSPIGSDVNPENNFFDLNSQYVGSYDPNDKTCVQGEYFTPQQLENNEDLNFIIRFQNTGTYQADNIRIRDTLSQYLDISTLRIIGTSHPVRLEVSGSNIIDFNYDNIFLPDSFQNEPLSHGFVKYAVKCFPGISIGSAITNTAYIYFDFNEPIITNTTTTLHAYPLILSTEKFVTEAIFNSILVYPNPANEAFSIDARGVEEKNLKLALYDSKGSCVQNRKMLNPIVTITLEGLSSGLYFGIITNIDKEFVGSFKLVKE